MPHRSALGRRRRYCAAIPRMRQRTACIGKASRPRLNHGSRRWGRGTLMELLGQPVTVLLVQITLGLAISARADQRLRNCQEIVAAPAALDELLRIGDSLRDSRHVVPPQSIGGTLS